MWQMYTSFLILFNLDLDWQLVKRGFYLVFLELQLHTYPYDFLTG